MKDLIMADLHFDSKHLIVTVSAFIKVMEFAKDNGYSRVIIAGDIYHDRPAVPTWVRQVVEDLFYKYKEKGFEFLIVAGNHDMPNYSKRNITSLSGLYHHANVFDTMPMRCDGIGFIPYNHNVDSFKEEFKKLSVHKLDMIVIHQGVDEAKSAGMPDMGLNTNFFSSHFDGIVIAGDYHKSVNIGKFLSPGSLIQRSFNDVGMNKGFWTLDDGEFLFHKAEYPEFVKMHVEKFKDVEGMDFAGKNVWIETYNSRIIKKLEKACEESIIKRVVLLKKFETSYERTIEIADASEMFEKCLDIRGDAKKLQECLFHRICVSNETYKETLDSGFNIYDEM